jgi:hypothetical protein
VITCDVLGNGPRNGGLGNQLFCIAAVLSLSFDNDDCAVFPDLRESHYKFYADTIFHRLDSGHNKDFVKNYYKERPYTSTIYEKIPYKPNLCISGHFQSYKYFNHNRENIVNLFRLPDHMINIIEDKYANLINLENTVSIHVRRGDYLSLRGIYEYIGPKYYQRALSIVDNYPKIVIFSDDITWCKENSFFANKSAFFVENESDVVDLYLMSRMKNNIIANSTFSWWSAFLNKNKDKKVVAPNNWFGPHRTKNNIQETADLIPASWIRI